MKNFTLLLLLLSGTLASFAQTTVNTLSDLQTAIDNASAGAVIILANGTYTAGTAITIDKQGTASRPITIKAQTIGGAEITGTAGFSIVSPASHIVIEGFKFTHSASRATMAAGTSFCRWTRCLFETPGDGEDLLLNGNDHEVDYNTFQHKNAMGRFIAVRGSGSQIAQRLHIHHNYFLDQQPQKGNGAETL
ncbi:MAG TPA: chondroitinase-B domain-containing protein, partial [Puia sp.]|nr:chondroitinase-B domain-containing protein [Puia sp.]